MYIYYLWVAGSYKGQGIARDLLEYAIQDAKNRGMSGVCTLTSKKKETLFVRKKVFCSL